MGTGVLCPGVKRGRGVTLTTHLHLVPRSWMNRSCTPLPQAPPWRVAGLLYCINITYTVKNTTTHIQKCIQLVASFGRGCGSNSRSGLRCFLCINVPVSVSSKLTADVWEIKLKHDGHVECTEETLYSTNWGWLWTMFNCTPSLHSHATATRSTQSISPSFPFRRLFQLEPYESVEFPDWFCVSGQCSSWSWMRQACYAVKIAILIQLRWLRCFPMFLFPSSVIYHPVLKPFLSDFHWTSWSND
jgi:hypothetical protein